VAYITGSAVTACEKNPDPDCAAKFRQKRLFGDDTTDVIDDQPHEAIIPRLVDLLKYLDEKHPDEGWGGYLKDGQPKWSRLAVSGQSQGAGMAAFIAVHHRVYRAFLSSSPWDYRFQGRGKRRIKILAPWIKGPGKTPADDWFASYHTKEKEAVMLAQAYAALKIPEDHVKALTLDPAEFIGHNPHHGSLLEERKTPRNKDGSPVYESMWKFLVGAPNAD
jgi:hypothetical protein